MQTFIVGTRDLMLWARICTTNRPTKKTRSVEFVMVDYDYIRPVDPGVINAVSWEFVSDHEPTPEHKLKPQISKREARQYRDDLMKRMTNELGMLPPFQRKPKA